MGKWRFLTVVLALVAAIGFAVPALAFGPWGQGQGPSGAGVGCFGGGVGQTQTAGPGYGPGGMMGGWGYQGQNPTQTTEVSLEQARKAVDDYLAAGDWGEPLVVAEVMEFQNNFYAAVKEQATGVGAFELLVNKGTGYVSPEVGPNMMWNAKYGHMAGFAQGRGGMMGGWGGQRNGLWGPGVQSTPTAAMPVTAVDAVAKANAYLGTTDSGLTAENDPATFYGYYTIDVVDKDGNVAGMLSVNGQSGDVWYHTWHGDFVQEVEG